MSERNKLIDFSFIHKQKAYNKYNKIDINLFIKQSTTVAQILILKLLKYKCI